jgi:hypothetical protein
MITSDHCRAKRPHQSEHPYRDSVSTEAANLRPRASAAPFYPL